MNSDMFNVTSNWKQIELRNQFTSSTLQSLASTTTAVNTNNIVELHFLTDIEF
jgi:hypothetical protein